MLNLESHSNQRLYDMNESAQYLRRNCRMAYIESYHHTFHQRTLDLVIIIHVSLTYRI